MKQFRWIIDNPNDVIQHCLSNNRFYELDELQFMSEFIKEDDVVLDIGSNVGNHSVYLSKFTKAKTIYVIEPIPRSYRMLLCNLKLNYCDNVNVDYIGLALGNKDSIAYPCMEYGKDNLGATYLHPEPIDPKTNDQSLILDPVQVVSGDSIFENIHIDFIKMDVESMEIVTLEGLSKTITNSRPKMFVEVVDTNKEEFLNWVELNNYKIHSVHDKLSKGIYANYMIIPNE